MAQIEVYFTVLCSSDSEKCYMDKYAELCWEHLDYSSLTDESEDEFVKYWSVIVADTFNVPQVDIQNLFSKTDPFNSNSITRFNWKYGTGLGISGTPAGYVNGVKLDDYPANAAEWKAIFNDMFTNPSAEGFMQK